MKIGVDLSEWTDRPTGVGTYVRALLDRWLALGPGHRDQGWRLYARRLETLPEAWSNAAEVLSGRRWSSRAVLWQQLALPRLLHDAPPDVLFCPAYAVPPRCRAPLVVALHDLSFERDPSAFSPREAWRRRWLARRAARRSERILTLSESSADEIQEIYGVPRERIAVVPLGVEPHLHEKASSEQQRALRQRLELPERVVLHVGTLLKRRHLPALLEAFAALARRDADLGLVIVGENRIHPPVDLHGLAERHQIADRTLFLDYLSDSDLHALFSLADAFVSLSDYEGFGLPPLEAMACGTPTVVLDASAAAEYWSRYAHTVARPEPGLVADAIADILADPQRGLRHREELLRRFDWDRSAAMTLEILREVGS